jgi:ubiquinone/menaquinone biosynthesis C-methylase UbiE
MSAPIDALRVRALFAEPQRVAAADFLRREIAARMHERLSLVKIVPQRVLDAGCGTGPDLGTLQKTYPAAQIVGMDASSAMLAEAKTPAPAMRSLNQMLSRLMPARAGVDLLCGDFGSLPFGPNSIDLVWSNLALHWHPQPDRVFAEWRRVLRVDGLLMFSNFGPDTFKELRAAFAELDETPHTLPFSCKNTTEVLPPVVCKRTPVRSPAKTTRYFVHRPYRTLPTVRPLVILRQEHAGSETARTCHDAALAVSPRRIYRSSLPCILGRADSVIRDQTWMSRRSDSMRHHCQYALICSNSLPSD